MEDAIGTIESSAGRIKGEIHFLKQRANTSQIAAVRDAEKAMKDFDENIKQLSEVFECP